MELSQVKLDFNNEVIKIKKFIIQAKTQTINNLSKKLKQFKSKDNAPVELKEKIKRKTEVMVAEIFLIKKIKIDELARFAMTNFDNLSKAMDTPVATKEKAMAKLISHKSLKPKFKLIIEKFSNVPTVRLLEVDPKKLRRKKRKEKLKLLEKNKPKDDAKDDDNNASESDSGNDEGNSDGESDMSAVDDENRIVDGDAPSSEDNYRSYDSGEDAGGNIDSDSEDVGSDRREVDSDADTADLDDQEKDSEFSSNEEEEQSKNKMSKIPSKKINLVENVYEHSPPKMYGKISHNNKTKNSKPEKTSKDKSSKIDKAIKLKPKASKMSVDKDEEAVHENSDSFFITDDSPKTDKIPKANRKIKKMLVDLDDETAIKTAEKRVDSFFKTDSGSNYLTVALPRPPDINPEDAMQNREYGTSAVNRKMRRAKMFGTNVIQRPKKSQHYDSKMNSFKNQDTGRFNKINNYNKNDNFNESNNINKNDGYQKGSKYSKMDTIAPKVEEKLHPSWEAKKQKTSIVHFKGKKITFD